MSEEIPKEFRTVVIPQITEVQRDELRAKVGLHQHLGGKPVTHVATPWTFEHATDEYINYDAQRDAGKYPEGREPKAPGFGVGRRRAGILGDIASSRAGVRRSR